MIAANFKVRAIRSKTLREAARDEPCTLCGKNDGTVVPAHSNLLEDGRGFAHKSHDLFCAWLCAVCHHEIDYGKNWSRSEKFVNFHRALKRTWMRLIQKGVITIAGER